MDVNDILDALLGMGEADLSVIADAAISEIKTIRKREAKRTIAQLTEGDDVRVIPGTLATDALDGKTMSIVKVNRTRVVVNDPRPGRNGRVTIPASSLEKV